MKLYHGSLQIVKEPQIIIPDRTLDYGVGFYTTTSSKQAKEWTILKLKGKKVGYVNVYEFDEKSAAKLKRLIFCNPPADDWLDFVIVFMRHLPCTKMGC